MLLVFVSSCDHANIDDSVLDPVNGRNTTNTTVTQPARKKKPLRGLQKGSSLTSEYHLLKKD